MLTDSDDEILYSTVFGFSDSNDDSENIKPIDREVVEETAFDKDAIECYCRKCQTMVIAKPDKYDGMIICKKCKEWERKVWG